MATCTIYRSLDFVYLFNSTILQTAQDATLHDFGTDYRTNSYFNATTKVNVCAALFALLDGRNRDDDGRGIGATCARTKRKISEAQKSKTRRL